MLNKIYRPTFKDNVNNSCPIKQFFGTVIIEQTRHRKVD